MFVAYAFYSLLITSKIMHAIFPVKSIENLEKIIPRKRGRETFLCVPGQKTEGIRTKKGSKRGLLESSRFRAHHSSEEEVPLVTLQGQWEEKEDASLPLPPLMSPTVATFPDENLTAPGLIDTSSTPSPAFLSPLPAHPPTHLSHFLSHLSLDCSHLPPFRSSSPLGLLLVSSIQSPNLAFAHARLDLRPYFAHCSFYQSWIY